MSSDLAAGHFQEHIVRVFNQLSQGTHRLFSAVDTLQ